MNRIFFNTLIFVCSLFVGGVIVVFSLRPEAEAVKVATYENEKVWSKISLSSPQSNVYKVKSEIINADTKVSQNTPILVDFGRLSSFLYLAGTGSQSSVLTESGSTGVVLGNASGIMSLYDLFLSYTIFDDNNTFRLEQITNGSFYIRKEDDGKIALYAIDGVIRLTFIHQGEDMTNMILFPGSYIRFDPARNRSLKNADLFRTILSLKDVDNEVFEFVNPRVNIGDEQDTFFNYRLPKESMTLFRILSARFKEKVETIDMSKRYRGAIYDDSQAQSTWLMNPSKKNHNMLSELSFLLSKALDSGSNTETLIGKIGNLYNQAKGLNIKDSTAKSLVEQFLLDGRFALYAGVANGKYQETYEAIAKMIGIQPTFGNSRLFQSLADIYSRNLFTQKKSDNSLFINTYSPTATELFKTLDKNEIDQKDYFDIAIYAHNILNKMEESPKIFDQTAIEDTSTYSYLTTFFRASIRYINSIEDTEKKQQTIMSFSRQFYDYILSLTVNSLYKYFVVVEDGALYLDPNYREGVRVQIPDELIDNIRGLNATIEAITPSIEGLWTASGQTDTDTYTNIKNNIIRLQAFTLMIDPDTYKDYIKTPYKVESSSGATLFFPAVDPDTGLVIRFDKSVVEKMRNTKTLSTDPRIKDLKKIWPDADASAWTIDGEDIRIVRAPYRIARSDDGTSRLEISALYKDKTFSDGIIDYNGYTIQVVSETPMTLQTYYLFLSQIHYYLDIIDTEMTGDTVGELRIFPSKQRINIGESLYAVKIDEVEDIQ